MKVNRVFNIKAKSLLMPKKTPNNKKNKRRKKSNAIMTKEEENAILNRNPAPEDIDSFIDRLIEHDEASPALRKFLVYVMERQAYGPELSDEFTFFCLSSYFILQNNYSDVSARYDLPSQKFLETQIFYNFVFTPGIRGIILELIKIKTEHVKPESKICVLLIDENVITPGVIYDEKYGNIGYDVHGKLANFVTTIMISPVSRKWVIPVAYFFTHQSCSADELQDHLFEAICKLDNIGIEVIGVVAKLKRNLVKLSQKLNISTTNQQFNVGSKNILFLFDVHHLINITRDNFLTYRFEYEGMCTSPKDIGKFFSIEWKISNKATITKDHIIPDRKQRIDVRYAVELLSDKVASVMVSYISAGLLPQSATGTAQCIELFDRLFRIMNSLKMNFDNPLDSVYYGGKLQVDFLRKMISFFENLKVYDISNNDRTDQLLFKKAWIISIRGVMQLWEVMEQKKHPHLCTNYVNFEFIDFYRRYYRAFHNREPTSWDFVGYYESTFYSSYFFHWLEFSPASTEFDIDKDYAQKIFKRIPNVSHDLTGKRKVDKTFYPESQNTAVYFTHFVKSWEDHFDNIEQLIDDQELMV